MANGISCAFFAGKNLIYGQKERNIFKEGIGTIQTVRTIDSASTSGLIKNMPHASGISKVAKIAKKVLYPLIILSGVFNTIKSDDKVKTGVTQASSIATMYTFETIAEKFLIAAEKKLLNTNAVKNNNKLKALVYILKGLGFVGASLLGYNVGNKVSESAVDSIRNKLDQKKADKEIAELNDKTGEPANKADKLDDDENIFADMSLIKEE